MQDEKLEEKPLAVFYAGTNGSGKSSLREDGLDSRIQKNIDPDAIARTINADSSRDVGMQAGRAAIRQFREAIENRESFSMETTLTGNSSLGRMEEAKAAGYEVRLRYVGLESADLNVERVANRVAEGGHHIEEDVIRRRWQESLDNLPKAAAIADKTRVRDNSGTQYIDCLNIENWQIRRLENENLPKWVNEVESEISKELEIKRENTEGKKPHDKESDKQQPREQARQMIDYTQKQRGRDREHGRERER